MTDPCATPGDNADRRAAASWRILEAVGYLEQCRNGARSFGILTGESPRQVRLAVDRFLAGASRGMRVARLPAPTDSSHVFLETVLTQLGFEPFESTADDLARLLTVVIRQVSREQAPICIVLDDAQEFGPHVFETIRELARSAREVQPALLFILGGSPALVRVLDSRGMSSVAALTRHRFDFSAVVPPSAAEETAAGAGPEEAPNFVLSLNQQVIRRFPIEGTRLLIGRGHHCDICIPSRYISRQHALLIRSPDGDWLVDLKSTNGTSVNSQLVTQRRLAHGDVISIGNHRLQYRNAAGSWIESHSTASHDQLSETMVMRSLQSVLASAEDTVVTPARQNPSAA